MDDDIMQFATSDLLSRAVLYSRYDDQLRQRPLWATPNWKRLCYTSACWVVRSHEQPTHQLTLADLDTTEPLELSNCRDCSSAGREFHDGLGELYSLHHNWLHSIDVALDTSDPRWAVSNHLLLGGALAVADHLPVSPSDTANRACRRATALARSRRPSIPAVEGGRQYLASVVNAILADCRQDDLGPLPDQTYQVWNIPQSATVDDDTDPNESLARLTRMKGWIVAPTDHLLGDDNAGVLMYASDQTAALDEHHLAFRVPAVLSCPSADHILGLPANWCRLGLDDSYEENELREAWSMGARDHDLPTVVRGLRAATA